MTKLTGVILGGEDVSSLKRDQKKVDPLFALALLEKLGFQPVLITVTIIHLVFFLPENRKTCELLVNKAYSNDGSYSFSFLKYFATIKVLTFHH